MPLSRKRQARLGVEEDARIPDSAAFGTCEKAI
jgi:hypothetical protein